MSDSKPYSVWNEKPFWCQPWTILLTGTVLVVGTWSLTRIFWVAFLVSLPVLAWWFVFLILYPRAMSRVHGNVSTAGGTSGAGDDGLAVKRSSNTDSTPP